MKDIIEFGLVLQDAEERVDLVVNRDESMARDTREFAVELQLFEALLDGIVNPDIFLSVESCFTKTFDVSSHHDNPVPQSCRTMPRTTGRGWNVSDNLLVVNVHVVIIVNEHGCPHEGSFKGQLLTVVTLPIEQSQVRQLFLIKLKFSHSNFLPHSHVVGEMFEDGAHTRDLTGFERGEMGENFADDFMREVE